MFIGVYVFDKIDEKNWNEIPSNMLMKSKKLKMKDFLWFRDLQIKLIPADNVCETIFKIDGNYLDQITEKPLCLHVTYGNEIFILNNVTRNKIIKITEGELKGFEKIITHFKDTCVLSSVVNGEIGIMLGLTQADINRNKEANK